MCVCVFFFSGDLIFGNPKNPDPSIQWRHFEGTLQVQTNPFYWRVHSLILREVFIVEGGGTVEMMKFDERAYFSNEQ